MRKKGLNSSVLVKRYIFGYKKRTAFLISVVTLSLIFFCSTGILFQSLLANEKISREKDFGAYDFIVAGITQSGKSVANVHPYIDKKGYTSIIGSTASENGAYVGAIDDEALALAKIEILKGRMPVKDGEAAVEATALQKLGLSLQPGEKLEISVYGLSDGDNGNSGITKEEFTVTGILGEYTGIRKNEQDMGIGDTGIFPGIVVPPETVKKYEAKGYTMKENLAYSLKQGISVENAREKIHIDSIYGDISIENTLHLQRRSWEAGDKTNIQTGVVFICLVALCTAFVIANSFFISIDEREKHLGILRAVGATSKQIRNLVLREAAVILAVSIPLGIFISLAFARLILYFLTDLTGNRMIMMASPLIIVGAALTSVISVFAASYLPALRAGRMTPVKALRNGDSVVREGNNPVSNWLSMTKTASASYWKYRTVLFRMAVKNITRNKARALLITMMISLSMAVFMFIYTSISIFYRNIETHRLTGGLAYDFRISQMTLNPKIPESGLSRENVSKMQKIVGIEQINAYKRLYFSLVGFSKEKLSDNISNSDLVAPKFQQEVMDLFQKEVGEDIQLLNIYIMGITAGQMEAISGSGNTAGSALYVPANTSAGFKKGDSLVIGNLSMKDDKINIAAHTINLGAVIHTLPGHMTDEIGNDAALFIDEDTYREFSTGDLFNEIYIYAKENADMQSIKKELSLISMAGKNISMDSLWETSKKYESDNLKGQYVGYTLCIVIAILAVSMYLNSMYASVLARKTEFAVMRAVGMTRKQLSWVIGTETFIYSVLSCLAALLICILPISKAVQSEGYLLSRDVSWGIFVLVFLLNILLGQIAARMPLKKVFANGIIDSMRIVEV